MDSELDRLFEAAKAADEAFRRHRLSTYEVGYEGGGTIGESTTEAARREWSERSAKNLAALTKLGERVPTTG